MASGHCALLFKTLCYFRFPPGPRPLVGLNRQSAGKAFADRLRRAGELPALGPKKDGSGEDLRVLPIRYDAAGRRFRDFSEAYSLCRDGAFKDWPYEGPRATLEFLNLVRRRTGG